MSQKYWSPKKIWDGQSAYIIGGGPSLIGFDWSVLTDENVIGCNAACYLPGHILDIIIFSDIDFWAFNESQLKRCSREGAWLVSVCPRPLAKSPPFVKQMQRLSQGFSKKPYQLPWNASTGAAAVSLALKLGARFVYLLGYDLGASPIGLHHYHSHYAKVPEDLVYERFQEGFAALERSVVENYPDCKIVNLINGSSNLKCFQTQDVSEHFGKDVFHVSDN